MALLELISEDMKAAMKSGDKHRLETLRTIRAGLLEKQVEKRPTGGMTPDDELAVLIQAAKKRKEAATIFRANKRNDLGELEEKELEIIQAYLPQQFSKEDVEKCVREVLSGFESPSSKDFGKVMPLVMKQLKGKADGRLIQETVKQMLGA